MVESVGGALAAYSCLGEELSSLQITGGAIVLAGILIA
jgi:drug/metabolite transporter (DMT)-like permease